MKPYIHAALVFIAIGAIVALIFLSTLPASAHSTCRLHANRNGQSVTVNRAPCYRQDFPAWCDAYIPRTIIQGQTIPCETVVIVATATPAPRPTPRATPTPLPYMERLRRSGPFRGFR